MKFFKTPFMRLYKEGLLRIKVLAIVCGALTLFSAVLSPITELVTVLRESTQNGEIEIIGTEQLTHPLLILMFFAPFFIFGSFSFLRHRNACDLYHALPYRRKTVYVAFALAAVTWVLLIAFVSSLSRAIVYALNPTVVFGFGQLMLGVLVYLIACLFLMGVAAIAVTLTGTKHACLFVYVMLLVGVRSVFFAYSRAFSELVPLVNTDFGIYAFLAPINFLPLTLLSTVLIDESVAVFTNASLLIYFAFIGMAAFMLSGVFFVRRKSESAGYGAVNSVAGHVFRFLVATPVLLCAVALIYMQYGGMVFVLSTVSFIVYFLFELIFAGKSRRMLSALKFAPLMFVFALLFAGVIQLNAQIALNKKLNADDILSIAFDQSSGTNSYENYATKDVAFEDEALISKIVAAHANTAKIIKDGEYRQRKFQVGYRSVDVAIRTKFSTRHYTLLMLPEDADELTRIKHTHRSYLDAYVKLPTEKEILNVYGQASSVLSYDESLLLWDAFSAEYAKLPFEQQMNAKGYNASSVFAFTVNGTYQSHTFSSHYSVLPLMTETVEVLQSYLDQQNRKDELLSCLDAPQAYEAGFDFTFVYCVDNQNVQKASIYVKAGSDRDASKKHTLSALYQSLMLLTPFDASKPYVLIDIDAYGYGKSTSGVLIYNINPEKIEQIFKQLDSQS